MKIFDCDRHVMEPLFIWEKYLDNKIYQQYPVHFKHHTHDNVDLPPTYYIGSEPILKHWHKAIQLETALRPQNSSARKLAMSGLGQLQSMDQDGVDKAFIFPTFTGYIVNHESLPAEVSCAYAQAYNRWILDYCMIDKSRLIPAAIVSRHDPKSLSQQVQLIAQQGFKLITIRPEPIHGYHLGDAAYFDFWQTCQQHNINIAFHGGTHLHGQTIGSDRFESRFSLHACSHALEAQVAFLSLLEGNVFELYPNIKFMFLEAGAAWVPYWLWRLDNICYPEFPALVKDKLPKKPSDYFKNNCYVSFESGEPCLEEVVKWIGRDKLLFGSDFPHPDHQDFSIEELTLGQSLSTPDIKRALQQNPLACVGGSFA
ncbi:amidohydrolase [Pseudoalteromonas sp. JBTF-M23]|uniref:Amidohydrolase n=1 Tax=Pseudoalteromonas caenipelagi TaxID=2726988 RepID=A0A849VDP2_9GAMM|nr:amidohydrolase family protein [Pseudoalteromonas caenipelagi]NOU49857.1 amidohydrolase [Pseudoalteromonas caenipelagi]